MTAPYRNWLPATMEREIAPNIVFRPIRSWHTGVFAGEGLTKLPNTDDRSGCILGKLCSIDVCAPPGSVTHRIYWNRITGKALSSFLSYPNSLGVCDTYFWEIYPSASGQPKRFLSEEKMEAAVISLLTQDPPT